MPSLAMIIDCSCTEVGIRARFRCMGERTMMAWETTPSPLQAEGVDVLTCTTRQRGASCWRFGFYHILEPFVNS